LLLPASRIDQRRWRTTLSCHRHRIPLFILLCCLALSQNAARGGVQNSIRLATPVSEGSKKAIAKDIKTQLDALVNGLTKGNDATNVSAARRTLIDNADTVSNGSNPPSASAAYQNEYATQLHDALKRLLEPANSRLVRLNAAIILGQVAEKVARTNNADVFTDIATLLLGSKEFEGQLWGLKIAKYVLASDAAKNGKLNNNLLDLAKLIVKTVENSKFPGEMIDEAYLALKFDPIAADLQGNRKQAETLAAQTLPNILDLVEWRTQQYKGGLVPNPLAESDLTGYLPVGGAFDAVNSAPELRDRTLKAMGELTCAQLKAALDAATAGQQPDQDLVAVARNCGSAMATFGGNLANANPPVTGAEGVQTAGQAISQSLSLTTPAPTLQTWCEGLAKALQQMNIQVSMP
jgi:hypothetical protein